MEELKTITEEQKNMYDTFSAEQTDVYNYLLSRVSYTPKEATETIERGEYTVFENIESALEYWSMVEGFEIPEGYTADIINMWLGNLEHDHDLLDKSPALELRYSDNVTRAEYMHQLENCLHESRIIYLYNQ